VNANTFASFSQTYPSGHPFALPANFTTTTSSETQFKLSNGNAAVISIPKGNEVLGSQAPFSGQANNAFSIESGRAAIGFISGGGTTLTSISATIALYAALTQATTVTSGTKIASMGVTGGIGNQAANWMADVTLTFQSANTILDGRSSFSVGSLLTGANAAVTAITTANLTSLNFGLTWTFATTSTSNTIGLVELSLEQV